MPQPFNPVKARRYRRKKKIKPQNELTILQETNNAQPEIVNQVNDRSYVVVPDQLNGIENPGAIKKERQRKKKEIPIQNEAHVSHQGEGISQNRGNSLKGIHGYKVLFQGYPSILEVMEKRERVRDGTNKKNTIPNDLVPLQEIGNAVPEIANGVEDSSHAAVPHFHESSENSVTKKKRNRSKKKKKISTQNGEVFLDQNQGRLLHKDDATFQEESNSQLEVENKVDDSCTDIHESLNDLVIKEKRTRNRKKKKSQIPTELGAVNEINGAQLKIDNEVASCSNANQNNLQIEKEALNQRKGAVMHLSLPLNREEANEASDAAKRQIFNSCKNLTASEVNDPGIAWMDKIMKHFFSFDDQLPLIVAALEANEQFYKQADASLKTFQSFFNETLPKGLNFCAKLFGSAYTHIALKDSDIDVFLDFGSSQKPDNLHQLIYKALKKQKKIFKFSMVWAIKAKVPIVMCKSFSGLSYDISFSQPFGLYSSFLIDFLLSLDNRIRPVIVILKFWFKKNGLSTYISSSTIILLVVFLLQQCKYPILPSIYSLQKNCNDPNIIEGWNVSFSKDRNLVPAFMNTFSVYDILKLFFEYYGALDFESYVICPYLGKLLPVSDLKNLENLPVEFELYKKYVDEHPNENFSFSGAMHLQDAVIHNRNRTKDVTTRKRKEFAKKCQEALKICLEEERRKSQRDYRCTFFYELYKPTKSFFYDINDKLPIIEIFQNKRDAGLSNSEWVDEFYQSLFTILVKVLKSPVIKSRSEFKNTENLEELVLVCPLDYNYLDETLREVFGKMIPRKMGFFLERQEKISDLLYENVFKGKAREAAELKILCLPKKNPMRIRINLYNFKAMKTKKDFILKVCHSLQRILPTWFEKSVKELQ